MGFFGTNMFSQYQMFSTMQNIEEKKAKRNWDLSCEHFWIITSRHFSQSSPLSSSTFSCSCSPGRVKMLMVRYFQQQDISSVWSWTKLIEHDSRKIKYLFSARLVKLILARKKGKDVLKVSPLSSYFWGKVKKLILAMTKFSPPLLIPVFLKIS